MEEDKKEESIERIIKILEQHLENSETMFEDFGTLAIEYADIKRISNVLSRLKQLEEENKKMAEEYIVNNSGVARYLNENYIFKTKVKEKIEELEKQIDDLLENEEIYEDNLFKYNYLKLAIEILEELLREEQ